MGASQSMQKIGFEDMQTVVKNAEQYIVINTLPTGEQGFLIKGTVSCEQEEMLINKYIKLSPQTKIVVYGKNDTDETVITKCNQLTAIGFPHVYAYMGGLFEWSLLQDIYGIDLFETTSFLPLKELLKYKPRKKLDVPLIAL
jgi:hypothetical protein